MNSKPVQPHWIPAARRRVFILVLLAAGLAFAASSDSLHRWLIDLLAWAEPLIRSHPLLGRVLFVLLAALSAMLAFVSSAILIPIGILTWGPSECVLLLWTGWTLGGICAYGIGRFLGRPVVRIIASAAALERYEHRVSARAPFPLVLLLQFALPSELPGYLLGLLRYRFWKYLLALALAEIPYAIATVLFGASFIDRKTYRLALLAIAMAAVSGGAIYLLNRWAPPDSPH